MSGGGVPGLLVNGRYRLGAIIGQGGMGRVWRAADEMLDRPVAIKEMRIDGLDAEDTRTRRERTLREARATARIDHPNVVRVYDVVDEGERLWIVMELVEGRSLERIMVESGSLSPRETARIGLGLVAALRQVHARGVLHRDIKPGNVLVEAAGERVVLTDFGIAALQDAKALTMVGMLVGSPDYMAPERISGRPQGPPSDVWSLGATLCAALGGRSPFSRDTTLATLHAVLYEEPALPAAAGPLRPILAALLEKEPEIRPGLDELTSALHPVAFPTPTPTVRVGGGEGDGGAGAGAGAGARAGVAGVEAGQLTGDEGPLGASETSGASMAPTASGATGASVAPRTFVAAGTEVSAGTGASGVDATDTARGSSRDAGAGTTREPQTPEPVDGADPAASSPWHPSEAPTPRYLGTRLVHAAREPRQPEPVEDAAPQEQTATHDFRRDTTHTPRPTRVSSPDPETPSEPSESPYPTAPEARQLHAAAPAASNASTEVPSELRSEARSEIPSGLSAQPTAPNTATQRPALGPHPLRTPEAPPPAAPVAPRRHRRRTAVLAGVGVVAAGVVVAAVLLSNSGSPDDRRAGSSTTPTVGGSPSPTVEGTARPPSLPPGTHEEAGGYAWATPRGWRRNVMTGAEVHYTSPDGAQELVAKSSLARDNLMRTWQQSEQNAHQGQDYRKIRLEETTFRGDPAVVWEYTFTLNGVNWHARLLGFNQEGRSYQINTWYHTAIEPQALKTYDKVKDSFKIL
ncbi:protein kinase [Streptomyces sp. NPDC006476]|uniref:serine/threonine-protein kinase n=1 Tax=Streptomyces sp. NPDC006476 TaxID=3157175 RepID=UPI0033AECC65